LDLATRLYIKFLFLGYRAWPSDYVLFFPKVEFPSGDVQAVVKSIFDTSRLAVTYTVEFAVDTYRFLSSVKQIQIHFGSTYMYKETISTGKEPHENNRGIFCKYCRNWK
jgi:hypothetical protein